MHSEQVIAMETGIKHKAPGKETREWNTLKGTVFLSNSHTGACS